MISLLYVDDEPGLLEIGKLFLERNEELRVDTETSAKKALITLQTTRYDGIISDYQMPEMDGISFLKEVRAKYPDLPFILFTGRGREEVVIEAINNGADFYLQKGGDPTAQFSELVHKIRQAVRRNKAERELFESRDYLDRIFSSVKTGIMVIDATTHRIRDINPTAAGIIGLPREQIVGMTCFSHVCPEEEGKCPITDLCQPADNSERVLLTADGRRVPIIKYVTRVVLSGTPCLLETFIDNTKRVEAEQDLRAAYGELKRNQEEIQAAYTELAAKEQVLTYDYARLIESERSLRESEEQYRTLFESANDGIVLLKNGVVVRCNTKTLSLFGCSDESEIVGHRGLEFSPEFQPDGSRSAELEKRYSRMGADTPSRSFEWMYLQRDGTPVYADVSLNPVEFGGVSYIQAMIRDISDRKHAEQATALANRKLYMMNEFTRHEISNTITGLLGLVDMAHGMPVGEGRDQINREMKDRIVAIQKQIQFTKEYQAVGVKEPRWQQVRGLIPPCSRLEMVVRPSLDDLEIYADPLVTKIFSYLAENVLKHGGNATRIEVRAELVQGHSLRIVFEDNGNGIPGNMKTAIFERRVGETKGMGLFLVREILAITGITIAETGTPGEGARFEIVVPEGAFRQGKTDQVPAAEKPAAGEASVEAFRQK